MHDCGAEKGLLSLQQVWDVYARLTPLAPETLALLDAAAAVLAEDACAACDLPAFTQSAMDGYAVRHADLASPLTLAGELAAGDSPVRALAAGEAVRIFTGAALPPGADTVVRQEEVTLQGAQLQLARLPQPGEDVRQQGEELRAGEPLLAAGKQLTPGRLAALAQAGINSVRVHGRPTVAVIITGKEVVRQRGADAPHLPPGLVQDANWPQIHAWLQARQLSFVAPVWVGDDVDALTAALLRAADQAQLVITTGGASVGDYDYLPQAASAAGFSCDFHGVAQRPGKPLWFGHKDKSLLLGLPGNPGAVLVGLYVHAAALVARLSGQPQLHGWRLGRLACAQQAHPKVALIKRMRLAQDESASLWLEPLPHQASHQLSNLADAEALVWLPAEAGQLNAGETLPFLSLD